MASGDLLKLTDRLLSLKRSQSADFGWSWSHDAAFKLAAAYRRLKKDCDEAAELLCCCKPGEDTGCRSATLAELAVTTRETIAALRAQVAGHCGRIAAQSELLSRRAESGQPQKGGPTGAD